ncbi:uncharacterized protein A1O9_08757, partial [Exophiala aquamarina CBS 119918]
MILAIWIPLILNARLNVRHKVVVGILLLFPQFITSSVAVAPLNSYEYMNWYLREASISIYVAKVLGIGV